MNSYIVTVKNVDDWITNSQLIKDMELELSDLFHQRQKYKQAVKLIRMLLKEKEIPQSVIVTAVFDDYGKAGKKACSLLLSKLEAHDYITRRREGKEKIVCWLGGEQ